MSRTGGRADRPVERARRPQGRRAARPTPAAGRPAASRAARGADSGGATRPIAGVGWRGRLAATRGNGRALRGLILGTIVVFLLVLLGSTVGAFVSQRSQIASMRDKVAAQERTVAELQREQERWKDPAYVEQQARTRLKFVKPGERSYTVLDADPEVTAAKERARARTPWYGTVWDSMEVADVPSTTRS